MVLICISLRIREVRHLFMLFVGYLHFLFGKCLFSSAHFFDRLVFLDVKLYELFLYVVF